MFNELVRRDQGKEILFRSEVVVLPVYFAGAGGPCCVCLRSALNFGGGQNRDYSRETENPNLFGWSAKSLFSSVDFPAPLGPEMTTGRGVWALAVMDCFRLAIASYLESRKRFKLTR
jgi:hypothetical protein